MTIPPSPASSSSPSDTQPSRKRQRSQSMQSDASSSSLKRTAADLDSMDIDTRSPKTDQMSTLTIVDSNLEIDSYMAEQGEDDTPALLASEPSVWPEVSKTSSPEEKVAYVETCKARTMAVGETWYLVERSWWKRWRKALTGGVDKDGPVNEQDLGPVDNSPLLDPYDNLLVSISEGVDMEFVPQEVWRCFISWYGDAIRPLPRRVIERGSSKQITLELWPPSVKVFRLAKTKSDFPTFVYISVSAGETVKTFNRLLAARAAQQSQKDAAFRVWKIAPVDEDWKSMNFPLSMLQDANGKILEDSADKTAEDEGIISDDCFVVEFKDESGWPSDSALPPPPTVTGAPPPLFNSKDGFFDRMSKATTPSATALTSVTRGDNSYGFSTPSWKSTAKDKPLEPGILGLGNMGNTCFMNSALQCLAHMKELTDYFLTGLYQEELNPDNPLGMHGAIAETFGALLQRIWATSGSSNSYSPREFKSQLQRFAPQFTGYQQHDSQELVAFLLDGLHEDLNRVLNKPYVENPDWLGGGDLELVELAQKSWEGYMKRNDSVIVDLFQGQYKSTLICPECEKVSITFDPFMYLTLPLPVHKKWKHTIYFVPWDLRKPHVKVPVEINRDASFKDLKILLGRWMDANPDNLLTLEIFNNRFYKNLDDSLPCGELVDNDVIVCFELPCNSQQSRTYKKQAGDPIIIPVYLCDANPPIRTSYLASKNTSLFGYPSIVAIAPEQANDVEVMYDLVLGRLQRWTANARDLFKWEESTVSEMDHVPITLSSMPPLDSLTEISEDGSVVTTLQQADPTDGDIVDEKGITMVDEDDMDTSNADIIVPRRVGTKKDIFNLRLQTNHKEYGTSQYGTSRWESWERRTEQAEAEAILLREGDAFYCEFDENMKAYYFGDDRSRWEHALWDSWQEFLHPEYLESKKAFMEKKNKGITLQDCLDEFTKEEKLGEDDPWYCPKCKKHQQATKKFDLWKAPDVLVVHLKRFSNTRSMRDKIDTLIDFPVEGLDLTGMIGEREIAKKLAEQGVDLSEFEMGSLDEPLVYDLFAVDEHMGGLGGGHYRAYALNHLNEKWYHFDDSYVTLARATDAVNPNAYVLFYRRRSTAPIGGKTHHKIEKARLKSQNDVNDSMNLETQLPTPPSEDSGYMSALPLREPRPRPADPWSIRSQDSNASSSVASPSPEDLPSFEESQSQDHVNGTLDPLLLSSERFDFPDPSAKASPTSSNEAEIDSEDVDQDWDTSTSVKVGVREVNPESSPDGGSSRLRSSSSTSSISDMGSFSDVNVQKDRLCAINSDLVLDEKNKSEDYLLQYLLQASQLSLLAVYLGKHDRTKVALLCGGGSGHEPAHAGYVGQGILTEFRNYTGDVLNFGLAKEQYAALHPDKAEKVKFVIVGDDVAVGRTQGSIVGRRGLAGTVLVYKIAEALAHRGASLDEVHNIAQWVASNVATIGVGLDHCHVPGTAAVSSHLHASEIEIGMGIHNESGNRRLSPNPPLNELIPHLLDLLTSTSDPERSFLPFKGQKGKDEVVVLVNNLGGVSELELGAIVGEVHTALNARSIIIKRVLSGTFMTSLNMPGFSISLLLLPSKETTSAPEQPLLLSLLDEHSNAPGWKWSSHLTPHEQILLAKPASYVAQATSGAPLKATDSASFNTSIKRACEALISAEPEITQMDTIAGDGDCGLTLKAGAEAVLRKLAEGKVDGADLGGSIIYIAQVAEEAMGGTSGALYSIFFSALAQGLHVNSTASSSVTAESWSKALTSALDKLYTYTRARPPSRTLVDPLSAFIETLAKTSGRNYKAAVEAAALAAEETRDIEAKAGRSAYVEGDRLKKEKVADPGAWGVKTILESLLK
ncbi:hypothetical protein H0H87_000857 [Tephrocybe sp. NHM501043]|nr:hypothetical protein H0H87_000857 [Tephrocybe sp. NHM501043]